MTSFGEFIINLFEKLGLYYAFSAIFIFVVVYVLFAAFLKQFFKDVFNDKQINAISLIIGFVVAMLSISIYGIVKLISYFLSFVVGMLLVILFILISLTFVLSKKPTLEGTNLRNVFLVVTAFIVTFIFVSLYYAYEQYILPIAYGGGGGGQGGPTDVYTWIFKPEVLIIPFIFVILGISIMAISMGTEQAKK